MERNKSIGDFRPILGASVITGIALITSLSEREEKNTIQTPLVSPTSSTLHIDEIPRGQYDYALVDKRLSDSKNIASFYEDLKPSRPPVIPEVVMTANKEEKLLVPPFLELTFIESALNEMEENVETLIPVVEEAAESASVPVQTATPVSTPIIVETETPIPIETPQAESIPTPETITTPEAEVAINPENVSVWIVLADCESGDGDVGPPYSADWDYNGPSGFDGGLQFLPSTFNSLNMGYDFAWQAPPEVQIAAGQKLLSQAGWDQWPSCSRRMRAAGYIE